MFVDGVCFLGGLMGKKMEHDKIDSSLLSGSDRFKLARTHTHTPSCMCGCQHMVPSWCFYYISWTDDQILSLSFLTTFN